MIPTINRSEFVIRQLRFYASVGGRIGVYIGDSSTDEEFDKVAAACARLGNQVKVVHRRLPKSNDIQAVCELFPDVDEPYSCFIGDDDFFIPSSLERCADFLTGHSDYSIAVGRAALFAISSDKMYGDIESLVPYGQRPIELSTASERLLDYLYRFFATQFSVHRTENFRKEMESARHVKDRAIREILTSTLAVVHGKAKQLDLLYLLRGDHPNRYLQPDAYDILTNPYWHGAYEVFFDTLSKAVAAKDGIPVEQAREVVKQGFWAFTSRGLIHKWNMRYGKPSNGLRTRLSKIPAVASTWHRLRSFLPAERNQMSLHALLRRSSAYNTEFSQFYKFITSPDV